VSGKGWRDGEKKDARRTEEGSGDALGVVRIRV